MPLAIQTWGENPSRDTPTTTEPAAGAHPEGGSLGLGQLQLEGHVQAQLDGQAQHQGRDQSDDQPLEYR